MFDVSFAELLVIALVALVVIGPERLPKVARMLGTVVGRIQRYVAAVKLDIERETQFQDLQQLQNEIRDSLSQAKTRLDIEMATQLKNAPDHTVTDKSATAISDQLIPTTSDNQAVADASPAQTVAPNSQNPS